MQVALGSLPEFRDWNQGRAVKTTGYCTVKCGMTVDNEHRLYDPCVDHAVQGAVQEPVLLVCARSGYSNQIPHRNQIPASSSQLTILTGLDMTTQHRACNTCLCPFPITSGIAFLNQGHENILQVNWVNPVELETESRRIHPAYNLLGCSGKGKKLV